MVTVAHPPEKIFEVTFEILFCIFVFRHVKGHCLNTLKNMLQYYLIFVRKKKTS